jgi:hypothetical protein
VSYLKQSHGMGSWKTRLIAKKSRGSQESGRKKQLVPPAWAKACAKQARAYRQHPRYADWCAKCDGNKVKWSGA